MDAFDCLAQRSETFRVKPQMRETEMSQVVDLLTVVDYLVEYLLKTRWRNFQRVRVFQNQLLYLLESFAWHEFSGDAFIGCWAQTVPYDSKTYKAFSLAKGIYYGGCPRIFQ